MLPSSRVIVANVPVTRAQALAKGRLDAIDQNTAIVQASLAASRAHGVAKPGPFGFQGGCDLVHFRKLGAQGTVIGPGDLAVAHKPDEFVPVDEFVACSLIYRDVAKAMLRNRA